MDNEMNGSAKLADVHRQAFWFLWKMRLRFDECENFLRHSELGAPERACFACFLLHGVDDFSKMACPD
ncbi:hypothetical protein [Parageobacillus thermoglucosidasius]|uniref:hypothetical protein n=1 Tax=Parageobacillus thermoglucosidasius TaxID=1426 RepID=UPI0030C6B32F